ncbi:MAG: hypothetical protein WCZ27_09075 [Tissierellaceae bacterium]
MEDKKQNLYIPQGLKDSSEIFNGFGKKEGLRALVVFFALLLINVFIFLIKRNVSLFIIFILTSLSASIVVTQKDSNNISVYDQVKFMIRFNRSQKYYKYKYLPEWGEKIEG